ncbi:macrolide transport system ATP-binding/permease protein [Geosporobacter subterraneus DSM 17957]|uniref:Macrolide transport system ATP-binding/permease protein n=1 Tax=Geosporobacter subterraneus DSM 17957 TaxID=1121919 RepID=A0A1M6KZP6_9FIRM|nr:ABC-F type ribosomal protection protein [Geosporobacter subterraneus]SHJ64349.1 macrolide transport system ATP-binding/permease protein [Geosporobacter subterraneus DSM 17957]
MLLIECSNVKKYFSDRLILNIENLKIYSEDRIGIVGVNGAGKTTLVNILSGRLEPDEGWVKVYGEYGYISQLESAQNKRIRGEMASKLDIPEKWNESMSGGEKNRFKLAESLENEKPLIFADEPTSNVDIEGIKIMESMLEEFRGALVLISHDRSFLDRLCNKIIEIENGKIKIYHGNFSEYKIQKDKELERAHFEYDQYVREKRRLEGVIQDTKEKVKQIRKTPKRMDNSEARLHKMGNQKAKANLEKAVKSVETRIKHLEVKQKPIKQEKMKLDLEGIHVLHSKIIIEGEKIQKAFGDKKIFNNAEFSIYNGAKVALIGPNGCGKSTLVKMIMNHDPSIRIARGAKIGYFSQDLNILEESMSILENVMGSSIHPESYGRRLLARLLFKGEDVYKKVGVLSGGERVKISFAKILLQDMNLLILDEPTNYMDIYSLEAVEEALREYERTLLFVTHDRSLINSVADHIMTIENQELKMFKGSYQEYLFRMDKAIDDDREGVEKQIRILENRLSEVLGKLSMPSKKHDIVVLDQEYYAILKELKRMRENLQNCMGT